jgi:hypothetical protein
MQSTYATSDTPEIGFGVDTGEVVDGAGVFVEEFDTACFCNYQ